MTLARIALFALLLGGCAQATQIVLVVDTDLDVPGELTRVDIDVLNSVASPTRVSVDLTEGGPVPLTLGITSRRSDADVRVQVRGYLADGGLLVRDAATRLSPGSSRMLRVVLARRCVEAGCAGELTCDETGCRAVDIEPGELPDWSGSAPVQDGPACSAVDEVCNLVDDDCDDVIDETIMRLTDAENCGRCGHACTGACENGYCDGETPTTIAAGSAHTCVRREGGGAACFGWNDSGALGSSALSRSPIPLDVPGVIGASVVAPGGAFTCVLDARGQIQCVGDGDDGALGRGDRVDARTFGVIAGSSTYTLLAAGPRHACAAEMDGTVVCWGDSTWGEAGPIGPVLTPSVVPGAGTATALATGLDHSCSVVSGSVLCWGRNESGQLGLDPATVPSTTMPSAVPGLTNATAVALGRDFTCALTSTSEVYCWGNNASGQLGSVGSTGTPTPRLVTGISDATALSAAAGGSHACALRAGGRVSCWGANASGQLGDGTTVASAMPVDLMNVSGAIAVATGGLSGDERGHTCVLLGSGEVRCVGDGTLGQTGDPMLEPVGALHTVAGLP